MSGDQDIVERLRQSADTSSGGCGDWYQLVYRCHEAADEIERLRAAGDALVDALDGSRNQITAAADRWNEARK